MSETQRAEEMRGVIKPIIDSQNPPLFVESLMVGESPMGTMRLIGFSGELYIVRSEVVIEEGEKIRRDWVRPVFVADLEASSVEGLTLFSLNRLIDSEDKLEALLEKNPQIKEKLVAVLPRLTKLLGV